MKKNNSQLNGILHQARGKPNYSLRRYYPSFNLCDLVEQFWLVDWSLQNSRNHTQQNLPDPNFHLVFDATSAKLLGPVSKVFSYNMANTGKIVAVKFELGALAKLLDFSVAKYTDQQVPASEIFGGELEALHHSLFNTVSGTLCDHALSDHPLSDHATVEKLENFLAPFAIKASPALARLREQVTLIQSDPNILSVEELSSQSHTSVRTLQRNFLRYLGLSPKWLIRKYRLHQALSMLENNTTTIAEVAASLHYADQAHFIKDFKDILGVTPNRYLLGT